MNTQILSEISLLEKTMNTSKLQLKWRLENEDVEYNIKDLERSTTFGEILYTISRGLSPKELLDISDEQMVKHIQKVQLKEKETY